MNSEVTTKSGNESIPPAKSNNSSEVLRLSSPTGEYSTKGTVVLLQTSMGNIAIQTRDDRPITTQNFVSLVKKGFYDGTYFHRVIAGFMIQGGHNPNVEVATIHDEIGLDNRNVAGTIAMAKTSRSNSATSQFFINVADNGNNVIDRFGTKFDSVFTVFGQVIDGLDIVIKISQEPVTWNAYGENSQPATPVMLVHAAIIP